MAALEGDLGIYAAVESAADAGRLRRALADKAAREGHPAAAQQLQRDLKISEHSGEAGGSGVVSSDKPSVPGVLAPEAGPAGRPGQVGAATEGLPPLQEKVAATARQSRGRAAERAREHIEQINSQLAVHIVRIESYRHQADRLSREENAGREDERPGEDPEAAVARLLGRSLTPTDKVLVRGLLDKGKKPAEIATTLRELDRE